MIGDDNCISIRAVLRERLLLLGGVVGNSSIDFRLSFITIFKGGRGGGDKAGELESGVSGVSGEKISGSALALVAQGRGVTGKDPETSGRGDAGISSTGLLSTDNF